MAMVIKLFRLSVLLGHPLLEGASHNRLGAAVSTTNRINVLICDCRALGAASNGRLPQVGRYSHAKTVAAHGCGNSAEGCPNIFFIKVVLYC